ncbi:MAG: HAD family hydrolase [Oscillospiraceae bacterium]|nr:HAD family hydrolase [Oscillospiraceae bacterium]
MTCRLIAFDLDGTFLDEQKRVPEENLQALRFAAERGAVIVPATGRIYRGVPEELKNLSCIRYYILSNGATVYDAAEDAVLYRGDIPLELALRAMDYLDTQPVLYDCYQDDVGWISEAMFQQTPEYMRNEPEIVKLIRLLRIRVPDLKETLREHNRPVQKVQFYYRPEDNDKRLWMLRHFSERFPELVATTSVSNNIELNSVYAGKGNGLLALCGALGVDPAEAVAFGDGSNDISLLQAAGRGVAMANASEEVKAAADAMCESNVDFGVAKEIARLYAT